MQTKDLLVVPEEDREQVVSLLNFISWVICLHECFFLFFFFLFCIPTELFLYSSEFYKEIDKVAWVCIKSILPQLLCFISPFLSLDIGARIFIDLNSQMASRRLSNLWAWICDQDQSYKSTHNSQISVNIMSQTSASCSLLVLFGSDTSFYK